MAFKNLRLPKIFRNAIMDRNLKDIMPNNYTQELELLILGTLLPIYEKYQANKGIINPLSDINPKLLVQIKHKKPLAALLRPYEKLG